MPAIIQITKKIDLHGENALRLLSGVTGVITGLMTINTVVRSLVDKPEP